MISREEFENKPEWRATIKRRNRLVYILEGKGILTGRFYEYPDNWVRVEQGAQPFETEMHGTTLRRQLEIGQIELVKGEIPKAFEINPKTSRIKN